VECWGPTYQEHAEVVSFFETAVAYHQQLPTWGWLSAAGIRPSNNTNYTLADIQAALTKGFGHLPFVGCAGPKFNETAAGRNSTDNGRIELSEVWYYQYVYGRPQRVQPVRVSVNVSGTFITSCAKAKGAIKYYQRTPGSVA
jgi:ribonuclease T2